MTRGLSVVHALNMRNPVLCLNCERLEVMRFLTYRAAPYHFKPRKIQTQPSLVARQIIDLPANGQNSCTTASPRFLICFSSYW